MDTIRNLLPFLFQSLPGRFLEQGEPADDWLARLQESFRARFGPPLKTLHEPLDAWLQSLPMWVAMVCAIGLYVVAVIWVWGLRREFVFRGSPDSRWWRDLRIWATVVVLPYIAVYLMLGR